MHLRMRLQIVRKGRMILDIFLVGGERRILREFAGDVVVIFQKLVEAC
jgi:hypothetical protein